MAAHKLLAWLCGCVAAVLTGAAGSIFHEGSRVLLAPNKDATYFGYSVMLRNTSPPQLIVGAPIAMTTHAAHAGLNNTGAVYTCLLNLIQNPENITCDSLEFDTEGNTVRTNGRGLTVSHYKDEMWLGAVLANVENGSLVICAPRWANKIETVRASHRLVNGLCYVVSPPTRAGILVPMVDKDDQVFVNRERPEFGPPRTVLNYYAYAQAGFSAKISSDSTTMLLGAPGLLQWTGGVTRYSISFKGDRDFFGKQPVVNPYFTKDLGPDSYFGYAVDMGVFEGGGQILGVGGAPRGRDGLGQVLVFELKGGENTPMSIKASLTGSQLGAYFGGVLLVMDVNNDGLADLLVAAPLHADKGVEDMPHDQGIVYVYLNRPKESGFTLELVGTLKGSGAIGARFGSALADLGDVDDGGTTSYREVAIGAPWESEGLGAVYVYRGGADGFNSAYAQRLSAEYKGFGYSVTGGIDIDRNGCNDLVVGALNSDVVLLYRCTRVVYVAAEIRVAGAFDLPENATNFDADFCIVAFATKLAMSSSGRPVAIDVIASVTVDAGGGRAVLTGDAIYTERNVEPSRTYCKQQNIVIHREADLTRPITLTFNVKAAPGFPPSDRTLGAGTRLGMEAPSQLSTSLDIQVTRDCGEDLICQPAFSLLVNTLGSHPLPNATLSISREKFAKGGYFEFGHFFAITNYGPSDLPALTVHFSLPPAVSLGEEVTGCTRKPADEQQLTCTWNVRARHQSTALLLLRLDLHTQGELLQREESLNFTTEVHIPYDNQLLSVTSCLSLEPAPPVWPAIVGALLGLLLVAAITFGLYKGGFFGREQRARLQRLKEELALRMRTSAPPGSMSDVLLDTDDNDADDADDVSREPSPLADFYAVQ